MECIKCKTEGVDSTFFVEHICCPDCGSSIKMGYHVCKACKVLWKTINGKVCIDSAVSSVDISKSIADPQKFIKGVDKYGPTHCDYTNDKSEMSDYINRCLKCNEIAVKVDKDKYQCSSCDFEWESVSVMR